MAPNEDVYRVIVTGSNSGLGYGICVRLIDTFLRSRASKQTLELIPTARDVTKSTHTAWKLRKHADAAAVRIAKSVGEAGISSELAKRIRIRDDVTVDLCSLLSVRKLAKRLLDEAGSDGLEARKIDALVCNAGLAGWTGLNWWMLLKEAVVDPLQAFTYPPYKIAKVGWTTKKQLPPGSAGKKHLQEEEPPLAQVFCANVFGHYMLAHHIMPLLTGSAQGPGRIIWVSSIEAYSRALPTPADLQGLDSREAYETSKRLTDVLAMTSELSETQDALESFSTHDEHGGLPVEWARDWSREQQLQQAQSGGKVPHPRFYVTSPGILATAIFPLPWILHYLMILNNYFMRWLGSPWHTITAYTAAVSAVWAALASQTELDAAEAEGRKGKWGSATNRWGEERVVRMEVEGWGWSGQVGERDPLVGKGRWKSAREVTKEERAGFGEVGRGFWEEMERLRREWDERLATVEEADADI